MKRWFLPVLVLLFATPCWPKAFAQSPMPEIKPGKNSVVIRGQRQKLYFYPGAGAAPHHKILFAPGDGGHRGFAIKIAENLARMGYDVYALDTKHYLSSFTGKTHLTGSDVMADWRRLADCVTGNADEKITLAGWSTGAGLATLAAADANKARYDGLIAISLGKTNILGWRWVDNFTYLTGKTPNEPTFQSDEQRPVHSNRGSGSAVREDEKTETFRIDTREQPQLRKQSRWILRRLATGNGMDQTTRGASRWSNWHVPLEDRGR